MNNFLMSEMNLPQVIIGGFPKCATTSLFYYLSSALGLKAPQIKEPGFFSNWYNFDFNKILSVEPDAPSEWLGHIRNLSKVEKILPSAYSKIFIEGYAPVDATPDYILEVEQFIDALCNTYPKDSHPFIVIIIRNPIQRLLSHYNMFMRDGYEYLPLCKAITTRTCQTHLPVFYNYLKCSLYSDPILKLLDSKLRDKVLIIASERLEQSPEEVIHQISRHCQLNVKNLTVTNAIRYNTSAAVTQQSAIDKYILIRQGFAKKFLRKVFNNQHDRDKLKALYYSGRSWLLRSDSSKVLSDQQNSIPTEVSKLINNDYNKFVQICAENKIIL